VKDSIKLTQPFISYYLSKWSRCHFVGVEALQQVCTALTIPVSVSAYLNFLHCIPMLNDFFTYKEWSVNCCIVEFYMSSTAFKAYLEETHCNIDFVVQKGEVSVSAHLKIEQQLEDQVLCVMYETANYYAETCHFGLPTKPPPAVQSNDSRDNELLYMRVPFIDATNGSIVMRSLDRVDAVKVSVSINLCLQHFSSLFTHS
jgi:hypothetical protein